MNRMNCEPLERGCPAAAADIHLQTPPQGSCHSSHHRSEVESVAADELMVRQNLQVDDLALDILSKDMLLVAKQLLGQQVYKKRIQVHNMIKIVPICFK